MGDAQRILIAANFTGEPISESLHFWLDALGMTSEIAFAPFGQLFQQLLDPASEISNNRRGANVILVKLDDWAHEDGAREPSIEPLRRNVDDFVAALESAAQRSAAPLIVISCPPAPEFLAQQGAMHAESEQQLADGVANLTSVYLVTTRELRDCFSVDEYYDAQTDTLGAIPYTREFFSALGTVVARRVRAAIRTPHKVLVLDCDNTLWNGVVGEAGVNGVVIDEARIALQQFAIRQRDAGTLICLCSKNDVADVQEVFDRRGDMVLRWNHIVAHRVNWSAKSENLKSLAAELNLGLDSFVFVDDSAFEIGEVRADCPEVLALQLPEDSDGIQRFVKHCWAFDRHAVTAEDRRRSGAYEQNAVRESVRKEAGTLEDFLRALELEVEIRPPKDAEFARLAQMTQRTNQFNVTTIRRDEGEIRRLCAADGSLEARAVHVRDRFGDYGLVGLVLFATSDRALRVDTMLLSCRALGRRVEYDMLAVLGGLARDRGCAALEIPFVRTKKNGPALDFLSGLLLKSEPVETEHVFTFSPEFALDAPRRAASMRPVAAPQTEELAVPVTQPQTRSGESAEIFERIMHQLASPQHVLAAIDSRSHKPQLGARPIVAPRNAVEQKIVDAWKLALRNGDISVTDNFFDLGGQSIDAVIAFAELRRTFGDSLNPSMLFGAPTVEALAALVGAAETARGASDQFRSLVPIQPLGSRRPLFCFHAGAGSILFYYPLGRALGTDQPVYALQPRGLYGSDLPHASLDEMVTDYLSEIRRIQPQGPYQLAGFCFGAIIAFAAAQKLRESGETARHVFSFDGVAPETTERGLEPWKNPGRQTAWRRQKARVSKRWLRFRNGLFDRYTLHVGGPIPTMFRRFSWYFALNHAIMKGRYHATPYAGSMTVFSTKGRYPDPTLGWSRWVTGSLTTHEIQGDLRAHRELLAEPMVTALAEHIERVLSSTARGLADDREIATVTTDERGMAAPLGQTLSRNSDRRTEIRR